MKKINFGQAIKLLNILDSTMQNDICRLIMRYKNNNSYRLTIKQLINYLDKFHIIRNICAHSDILIRSKVFTHLTKHPVLFKEYGLNGMSNSLYAISMVAKIFFSIEEFEAFVQEVKDSMNTLDSKLSCIEGNKIFNTLGFPSDWHKS